MPIGEQIEKVRKPFQRGYSDESPFEELVLAINRSLRNSVGKINKEATQVIIAKFVNRLRTVELKAYHDDENQLLKEAQKFLEPGSGRKWINDWFLKKEPAKGLAKVPAKESGKEPSQLPKIAVVDTAPIPVGGNAPIVIPTQVNRPPSGDFLGLPTPSDQVVSHSRAAGRASIGIESTAQSSSAVPVRRSSASSSRPPSEGSASPEMRCAACGQQHCLGSMLLQLQLLGSPIGSVGSIGSVESISAAFNREHRLGIPIIIVQEGIQYQVPLRVREIRKNGGQLVVVLWVVLLVLSVLVFDILSGSA